MSNTTTALVTGANSGLGFEAAAQLAEQGAKRVIVAARSLAKAEDAQARLIERVGRDPFEPLALDLGDHENVRAAAKILGERGGPIDVLLLNAGMVNGSTVQRTEDGIEVTAAASLVGHHILTMDLLNNDLIAPNGRIVIAGSEAARGDVPTMNLTDIAAFATEHEGGDRSVAIERIIKGEAPYSYHNMSHYANVKLFVAWWAASLAPKLPAGTTVNAVSPGSVPDTAAFRNQPAIMQFVMAWIMAPLMGVFGMAATVGTGAKRYLDAADFGPELNGRFYASAPGKMIGPLAEQRQVHVLTQTNQAAAWKAITRLTGADVASKAQRLSA